MWDEDKTKGQKGFSVRTEDMLKVMEFDIDNIFVTIGNKIIKQTLGIPMGSPASPAMAIALCMHCEHFLQESHPNFGIIQGYRYVDDLVAFLNKDLDENAIKTGGHLPSPIGIRI